MGLNRIPISFTSSTELTLSVIGYTGLQHLSDSQVKSSHERNFTQLILGGLSDEEQFTDALENYATVSDILLPTFFNVYKLCGEELCKKYLEFLLNHPILKKYRVEHV